MKPILTVLLALALTAGMLAGCTSKGTESSSGETPSSSSEAQGESGAAEPSSNQGVSSETGGEGALAEKLVPDQADTADMAAPDFLTEDQQLLYKAAYRMYYHFHVSGGFQPDTTESMVGDNGNTFYMDKGFPSYSAFREALNSVFTEDYANSLLNESQSYMDDGNDRLFSAPGDRGTNIFYVGESFELVRQTDQEIDFNVIGRYHEDISSDESADPAKETMESFPIKMVKTDKGWRFASFNLAK